MALTRDFKDTVMARARHDPEFREGLLTEAVECLLAGDVDAGKILLRDYINATIGFTQLSRLTNKKNTSLMRMLGPKGNPAAQSTSPSASPATVTLAFSSMIQDHSFPFR